MDELSQTNLSNLREKIDKLDSELLSLLNQRAELSIEIGKIKKQDASPIFCRPSREADIIKKIVTLNNGPLERHHLENLFELIFSISRELQKKA